MTDLMQSSSTDEQPITDSPIEADQAEVVDEPKEEEQPSQEDSEPKEEPTVEVNGETLTVEELKQGYMRQADYTRKTQELTRQPKEETKVDPEVAKAIEILKANGMVTKEDLELQQSQAEDRRRFDSVMSSNPELKSHKEFIQAYGEKHPELAWEDVIDRYSKIHNISDKKKIEKSKSSRTVKGVSTPDVPSKPKSVDQMTDKEYEEWKDKEVNGDEFI